MGVTFHTYNNGNLKTDGYKILATAKILLAGGNGGTYYYPGT